jgi:hypothetical protein
MAQERNEAGLRHVYLAKKFKRGQDYVSDVETGQKIMGVVDLVEWADAVGFDASDAVRHLQKPGKTRKVKGNKKPALPWWP